MYPVLFIQSGTDGVLLVNGQFCGPVGQGQAFPAGRDAEIYVQLFPFGEAPPLTAQLQLTDGRIERLAPQEAAYALIWPDGVIQLELRCAAQAAEEKEGEEEHAAAGTLLRFLGMRLSGDAQAQHLLMRPQEAPDLSAYEAAVPLRFAPVRADPRFDERAGLVRRIAPNAAVIDAALAMTVPVGQGMKRIERIEIIGT
ncbi:MAG: hypothetical protein IKU34_10615 [Clostridia bacterium]|nr:hypothetical protein [Clostridia bacterium]